MTELTFEKLDKMLHGKLSLTIQYARELAEERGFGKGYGWGKDRISRMVGWESCYRADGSPKSERLRDLLKTSRAYYATIKQLEAECIEGNERHLEDLDREAGLSPVSTECLMQEKMRNEREKRRIYAEILSR